MTGKIAVGSKVRIVNTSNRNKFNLDGVEGIVLRNSVKTVTVLITAVPSQHRHKSEVGLTLRCSHDLVSPISKVQNCRTTRRIGKI